MVAVSQTNCLYSEELGSVGAVDTSRVVIAEPVVVSIVSSTPGHINLGDRDCADDSDFDGDDDSVIVHINQKARKVGRPQLDLKKT